MINLQSNKLIIIAGPCAAESRKQVTDCATELKKLGVSAIRACLWKPRTQPGFEGVGEKGIPWLKRVAEMGITVATEVMLPEHVTNLVKGLACQKQIQAIVWLGARNQHHLIQREIAKRLFKEAPKNWLLMIKNQPWEDERHWLGILEHVLSAGFPQERIFFCHRGFCPNGTLNPHSFRNLPNFDMAMRVKQKSGRPMILDPSHIGGSQENVFKTIDMSHGIPFDGAIVEVHPQPPNALSDTQQQLTLNQFRKLLPKLT